MTKLIYVANVRMPTEKAHGYQVAKMCESFVLQKRRITRTGTQTHTESIEVELIIPTRHNEIKGDLFDYYNLQKNFKVEKVFVPDFINIAPLFLRKLGFFLQSLFFLLRLAFLKMEKGAIIYSRNPEIVWLFSCWGYKTIFESHRWVDSKIWLHKFFIKDAAKVITVTSFLKNLYVGAGFKNADVLVAPDGVDLSIFDIDVSKEEARKILNLPPDDILLGYTGRTQTMGMGKGVLAVKNILPLLSSLISTNRRIQFFVVEGVYRKKLALHQKAFDVLLMPFPKTTHYSYYMSPMKMFEYMASRRPIVSSDLPSIREVLNEQNAILVEPGNPRALAEGIKKVLDNPEFAQIIANQAYEDVKQYTWEKRAERIFKHLKI